MSGAMCKPGSWVVQSSPDAISIGEVRADGTSLAFADMLISWQSVCSYEKALRMAHLMASAPELLEMAECLQDVCTRVIEQYGPVQCGIDFAALGGGVNRTLAKANGSAS